MTATSGPGFCLMIETVQYAVMTETPLVLVVVQRLGPSTGGATQGAQGDVLLVEHCTSGGYTIPVFAPASAAEAWELVQRAFAWSERLRTPVVVLSDKEVSMTMETVDRDALPHIEVPERRIHATGDARFIPYRARCPEEAPDFAPVGGAERVVATGSAHDEMGRLRTNSEEVLSVLRRLQSKIETHSEEMTVWDEIADPSAETLVISYGVSARAARQACRESRAAFLGLKTLFPVPTAVVRERARGRRRVVIVEENLRGLYASVLAPHLECAEVVRVGDVGRMIPPSRVREAVEAA
jgi:2-oxoglutarate ferredoxin oxidoreductase subunit alpha